ncbi:LuxR C-terminal-related transcriptional regulator [Streptomyces sp. NPDC058685]|uniref:LuxR C-terminal-related transcriptional regulator n=1 Tax=Streptomyces sp. NPDC058685 TaxID=3346598 RepID=UPI003655F875
MGNLDRAWPFVGRGNEVTAFKRALLDLECHAFIIQGPEGVGKTRLAEECQRLARELGHRSGRAAASSDSGFPLASMAHLLPKTVAVSTPMEIFQGASDALLPTGSRRGKYVILVDDISLLDGASATLIDQLINAESAFLITTIQQGADLNRLASNMRSASAAHRIDLHSFDRDEIDEILTSFLGGTIEPRTAEQLYATSRGNALFIHELTLGALASNALTFDGEIWHVAENYPQTGLITDLINERLSAIEGSSRRLLELLSLCGVVNAQWFPHEVYELESAGLVQILRQGRREKTELSHPLYGKVLQSDLTVSRKKELLLEQVARIRAAGSRRREDVEHVAMWELTATGTADTALLMSGARIAMGVHDYRGARTLAAAARHGDDSFWPRLLLGAALDELGEPREALEVLKEASARASTDDEHVHASIAMTRITAWSLLDIKEALHLNSEAVTKVHTPEARAALQATRGVLLASVSRHQEALKLLQNIDAVPNSYIRTIGEGTFAACLAATGQVKKSLELARAAHAERLGITDPTGLPHPVQYLTPLTFALQESGRIDEAYAVGVEGWASASADDAPEALAWTATSLARCALLQGRPLTARRWAAQGAALGRRYSLMQTLHQALVRIAEAAALLHDTEAAERALREAEPFPDSGPFVPELRLGKIWLAVSVGNLTSARSELIDAAQEARELNHLASEARILTDLCRVGRAQLAVDRLSELADATDGELTKVRARYAAAMATKDPQELFDCSSSLAEVGANLMAAESASAAATTWERQGSSRRATTARNKAISLARKCQGARTPDLIPSLTPTRLTERETQIALLVSQGSTTAEVAKQLIVSKRTVDNHLQTIFRKLGITSRKSLTSALSGEF